jgi:cytochrome c553
MGKKVVWLMLPVLLIVGLISIAASQEKSKTVMEKAKEAKTEVKSSTANLEKTGKHLVTLGGCNDCHSPKIMTENGPQPDETRLLSGHPSDETLPSTPQGLFGPKGWGALTTNGFTAWVGPWGTSFAYNLTPDNNTGLGSWTPDIFIRAMRTGKHMGAGRQILPPMPWNAMGMLSDEDLKAIFAYLKSIPAISNQVPQPIPPTEDKGKP